MKRFTLFWLILQVPLFFTWPGAREFSFAPPTPFPVSPIPVSAAPADSESSGQGALRFENIGLDDGLSQSSVHSILQDRQGFLWIGTEDGLNRYDGYQFRIYRPLANDPNSLSDRWISALFEDRDGILWIGTRQGGLNRLDPRTQKFTHYQHRAGDEASLSADNVSSILQDAAGTLWIGTTGGLDQLDPKTGQFRHFRSQPKNPRSLSSNRISALYLDGKGTLWIGTSNAGLDQFDPATGVFRHTRFDPKKTTSISSNDITTILGTADGQLWVGTNDGLSRLNPQSGQAKRFLGAADEANTRATSIIHTLYLDHRGTLWAGTDQGLDRFDQQSQLFINYHHISALADSLTSNSILSIYEDREGVLWVGTYSTGVNKYNPGKEKFSAYRHNPEDPGSLGSDVVLHFYVEPGGVTWIGTEDGLDRLDPATGKFLHYWHDSRSPGSLIDNVVWTVIRDSQRNLWIGTNGGLDQLDEVAGRFIHHQHDPQVPDSIASNIIYCLYEDPSGVLWIGTGEGLDRYDQRTGQFLHIVDPNNKSGPTKDAVISIYKDGQASLWAGTFNSGLFHLDINTERFTYYQNDPQKPGSLNNDSVLAVTQDHAGNLWIATAGGGLNRYIPATDSFTALTQLDGLPNDVVYGVVEDRQGFLWVSTNFGVSRYDPNTRTFRNYTARDGLAGNEFSQGAYTLGPDGAIYFGGVSGFNVFYPERIRDSSYLPPVALTGLTLNGKPVQSDAAVSALRDITLRWPQDSFEFDFTALSFAEPKNNRFAYKLDNFDSDWNEIGNAHTGRYTNLPGGNYTLRLRASNSDGVWNETGTAIRVTVIAPFWQTRWFYALVGLAALLAVAGVYRLRVSTVEAQKQELERQVGERTREMQHLFEQNKELAVMEERNRLARELHDSAKQKAFASLAQLGTVRSLIAQDMAAAKEHLGEAENLVYEVIQELTFLIQEMYPIALKEKGLTTALQEYVFEWETRNDIRINMRVDGETPLPLEVEQAVYRIVQEALANIARHSAATTVEICVIYCLDHIEVRISDNGQGFDLGQKPNGIGLRSMKERAKSIAGTFDIQSVPGGGTEIRVAIPTLKQPQPTGGQNG